MVNVPEGLAGRNPDCKLLEDSIAVLEQQHAQSLADLTVLRKQRALAIENPSAYISFLQTSTMMPQENLGFVKCPSLQTIISLPTFNFAQYRRNLTVDRRGNLPQEERIIEASITKLEQLQADSCPKFSIDTSADLIQKSSNSAFQAVKKQFIQGSISPELANNINRVTVLKKKTSRGRPVGSLSTTTKFKKAVQTLRLKPVKPKLSIMKNKRNAYIVHRAFPWYQSELDIIKEWIKAHPEDLAAGNYGSLLKQLPSRRLLDLRPKIHEILNFQLLQEGQPTEPAHQGGTTDARPKPE